MERAIDVIVIGFLIAVAIRTPDDALTRAAALISVGLILFGWFMAWRRRR
jgi:hypothetical protein